MVRRVSLIIDERANQHLRLPERDAGAQRLLEFQPEAETDVAEFCPCAICAAMIVPVLNFSLESLCDEVHPSVNGFFLLKKPRHLKAAMG